MSIYVCSVYTYFLLKSGHPELSQFSIIFLILLQFCGSSVRRHHSGLIRLHKGGADGAETPQHCDLVNCL